MICHSIRSKKDIQLMFYTTKSSMASNFFSWTLKQIEKRKIIVCKPPKFNYLLKKKKKEISNNSIDNTINPNFWFAAWVLKKDKRRSHHLRSKIWRLAVSPTFFFFLFSSTISYINVQFTRKKGPWAYVCSSQTL